MYQDDMDLLESLLDCHGGKLKPMERSAFGSMLAFLKCGRQIQLTQKQRAWVSMTASRVGAKKRDATKAAHDIVINIGTKVLKPPGYVRDGIG